MSTSTGVRFFAVILSAAKDLATLPGGPPAVGARCFALSFARAQHDSRVDAKRVREWFDRVEGETP